MNTKDFKNTWIIVYKDALGCFDEEDNLTDVLVPTAWLKNVLLADGITDFENWLSEYTADSTDAIVWKAMAEGVILKCCDKRITSVLGLDKEPLGQVDRLLENAKARQVEGTFKQIEDKILE